MTTLLRSLAALLLLSPASLLAQPSIGAAADGVLGQPDFTTQNSGVSASEFNGPNGVAVDPASGKLFVVDRGNHRVLRFSSEASVERGGEAEAVFGQSDFVSGASGLAADRFNNPIGVHIDGDGRMWLADFSNNRVLWFDDAATKPTGAPADGVLGQPNFVTGSSGLSASAMRGPVTAFADNAGRVWVTEFSNHRVTRFDAAASKANGAPADGVIGQPDFVSGSSGLSASALRSPNASYVDAEGRLYVSDNGNRRVVRFDAAAAKPDGAAADGVLGQPDFVTNESNVTREGMTSLRYVFGDSEGRLYVVQEGSHRITIYNDAANRPNGAPADAVLGQPDFTTGTAENPPTASGFNTPRAIYVDDARDRVWVADWRNNRVLRFDVLPAGTPGLALAAPNGGEFLAIGTVFTIRWSSQDVAEIGIEYRTDDGAAWMPIATVAADAGQYDWTVPDTPTDQARVRIYSTADPSVEDISDAPFSIASGDDRPAVIVVLGSSTAAGTGASSTASSWVGRYRAYVQELDPEARVVNLAVGGYTTYDVLPTGTVTPSGRPSPKPNNNITAALGLQPAAIIVNLPSNDASIGATVPQQMANFRAIRDAAQAQGVPIWFTTTQPRNFSDDARRQNLMAARDSILAQFPSRSINFWTGLATATGTIEPAFNSGDGIHLNDAGHQMLYNRVVGAGIFSTAVDTETGPRSGLVLGQNYPNPSATATTIRFSIPTSTARTTLDVFDLLGRRVASLVDGPMEAGDYTVPFDASALSSGVYVYRLAVGSEVLVRRMIVAR